MVAHPHAALTPVPAQPSTEGQQNDAEDNLGKPEHRDHRQRADAEPGHQHHAEQDGQAADLCRPREPDGRDDPGHTGLHPGHGDCHSGQRRSDACVP